MFLIATPHVESFHGEYHWMGRSCVMLHGQWTLGHLTSLNYKCHADLTRYINGYIPVMVQFLSCVKVVESFRGDVHFLYSHPVIHNDPWRPILTRGSTCIFEAHRVAGPRVDQSCKVWDIISWFYSVQTDVSFVIPFLVQIFQFHLYTCLKLDS